MYEQILPWIGLGVLVLLCLPILPVQKGVLALSAWILRLGMIALLAGGAYLWFQPNELPAEVSRVLNDFPGLLSLLPERGAPGFALCLTCWIVAALVPLLAALDVVRKSAGRVVEVRTPIPAPAAPIRAAAPAPPVEEPAPVGVPVLRPVERRTAAAAITSAGSRPAPRPAH
jgi:hypothetical protein